MKNKLKEAIKLLRRWDNADVPDTIWSEPGADYLLPIETNVFLGEVDKETKP